MNDDLYQFKRRDVIITGGTGFIGSHLSRVLLKYEAKVHVLVRKESDLWRLKDIEGNINILDVNMLDSEAVNQLISVVKPTYIFHCAIPPHSLLRDPHDLIDQIDITSRHLINIFQSIKSQKPELISFVHACSGAVYEWNKENYILSESTPLKPSTLRGMLKLNERNLCLYFGRAYKIPVRLARVFRAYGPWENKSKLIVKSLEAARTKTAIPLGSDTYKRDYIYIDDLINGILKLATRDLPSGVEMNFGSNSHYSASEIVEYLEEISGIKIPKSLKEYRKNFYDQGNFIANCSFAKRELGWESVTDIHEGLRATLKWYKDYYQWQMN